MSNAPIYKDSVGNWICKTCKSSHTQFGDAMRCSEGHGNTDGDSTFYESSKEKPKAMTNTDVSEKMESYRSIIASQGTIPVAESLVMTIIEDYENVRQHDISERGRPGALTMSFAKIAVEALNNHNKLVYGTKSSNVNVNVDATKKTDIEALKEMISVKKDEKYVEAERDETSK